MTSHSIFPFASPMTLSHRPLTTPSTPLSLCCCPSVYFFDSEICLFFALLDLQIWSRPGIFRSPSGHHLGRSGITCVEMLDDHCMQASLVSISLTGVSTNDWALQTALSCHKQRERSQNDYNPEICQYYKLPRHFYDSGPTKDDSLSLAKEAIENKMASCPPIGKP